MSANSWDLNANPNGGGGDKATFTKFPEGITRIRIVDDAPYQRWTHFIKKWSRSINCPGRGCPICEIRKQQKTNKQPYTYPMAKRFAMNVINRETGGLEILEQGKTFMEDVKDMLNDLSAKGKSLYDADLKVRRRGTGQDDTSYRIDIESEYPLSEADKKMLEKRVKFDEYFQPHTPEQILRIVNGESWEDVFASNQNNDSNGEGEQSEHVQVDEDEQGIELK